MSETLRIGRRTFHKNNSGVFEVSLQELSSLRFTEVPHYSTVEIAQLPGTRDSYRLSVDATHAGGPHNEDFWVSIQVNFEVAGNSEDSQAVSACNRRRRHVRLFFREVAAQLKFSGGPDPLPVTDLGDRLYCLVSFSRHFKRDEAPVLVDVIQPFVARFSEFLTAKHTVLFLCHASEDKPFVDRLCAFLDDQQVDVWYDRREIRVGESIVRRISDGLDAASHLVIVLSRVAVTKEWVLKELSAALMRQLQSSAITVLPLVVEDCRIPPLLADIKFADCRTDHSRGFRELLEAL